MEQKRVVIVMLVAMAIAILWNPALKWIGTQLGYNMESQPRLTDSPTTQSTTQPTTNLAAGGMTTAPSSPGTAPSMAVVSAGIRVAPSTRPDTPKEIGSVAPDDPKYR